MASAPGPENERNMLFYHEARVDGMLKRVETPTEMVEHFKGREDFLYYRQVIYGKRQKKFGPAEGNNPRPIQGEVQYEKYHKKMIEKYHRNTALDASEDISVLAFSLSDDKIQVTYHTHDDKISASTREYTKPTNSEEKGALLLWANELHSTFQVNHDARKKQVELYQILVELVEREDKCKEKIRESEEEVKEMLNDRTREETASELEISVYDTDRNEKAKKHRKELARLAEEEKRRKEEMELDYLAPFLAQVGDPERPTYQQALKLREDCLADLKQRLIDKANLIQARFEKETQELQKRQAHYQLHQVSMDKADEEAYLEYCSEAMFRIHILELRLHRHKEIAPHKYMELDKKIKLDSRLIDHLA